MKFEKKYVGKWVAVKSSQVVASDKTLTKLTKKVEGRKDQKNLRFTLIPNGFIAG
jgi:hypothetical protein